MAAVISAARPELPVTADLLQYLDQSRAVGVLNRRWIAEREGVVAGFADIFQAPASADISRWNLTLAVHPRDQGHGVGSELYRRALSSFKDGATVLRSTVRNTEVTGLAFLRRRGFDIESRYREMELDVSAGTRVGRRLGERSFELRLLGELAGEPERDRKLFALVHALRRDSGLEETGKKSGFEAFLSQTVANPAVALGMFLIAVHGSEYVGCTYMIEAREDTLITALTGVLPEYRRRGVATALKEAGLDLARAAGYRRVRAINDVRNVPMIALNERLGFEAAGEWLRMEKRIG